MATTIIHTPQIIQPVYNPLVYQVYSNKTNEEGFIFNFDLYVNGVYITSNKLLPIPNQNYTYYSPDSIIQSYLSSDRGYNYINTSATTNSICQYSINFKEEYINPWVFTSNRAVSGGTYNGKTEFYSTGTTSNPYVSGDTIYVVQNSGYTSSIYNGTFTVLSSTTSSVIVGLIHSINTPINSGKIYYSDKRKTSINTSTEHISNTTMSGSPGNGWSSYTDFCFNTFELNGSGFLQLTLDDDFCSINFSSTATLTTPLVEGGKYLVTFTVDEVFNPSNGAEGVRINLGGTLSEYFTGTGTFTKEMVCGNTGLVKLEAFLDADTGNYGTHRIKIGSCNVTNVIYYSGYTFNSVLQYDEYPNWDYTDYVSISGSTGIKFLTNQPSEVKIRENELASISYFNYGQFNGDDAISDILVTTYQKSGGTTINLIKSSANIYSGTNQTTGGLINIFGVGPSNLNQIPNSSFYYGGQPVIDFNRDYKYDVQLYNFSSVPVSEVKTYLLDDKCTKFDVKRFMFLNRMGQYDYFSATLLSNETTDINKTTYTKVLPYNYNIGDRGKTILNIDANKTFRVSSDFINQETADWLEELFTSPEVFIINGNGTLTPIIINNTSIERFISTNKKLFNYTFEYTNSYKVNTQNN